MRLIADGVVDREGVPGLAARLSYGTRQVERILVAGVGAGPLALARAQRAQATRLLIETTGVPMAQVAFAAGFSSVRQFNETVKVVFGTSPNELRRLAGHGPAGRAPVLAAPARRATGQTVVLRLPPGLFALTTCSVTWRPRLYPVSKKSAMAPTEGR